MGRGSLRDMLLGLKNILIIDSNWLVVNPLV